MTARDPFALGGVDPLVALGAERERLEAKFWAMVEDKPNSLECERLVEDLIKIEHQIAAAVPTSIPGIIVQLKYLRHYLQDFEWGEYADRIAENMMAGLERLDMAVSP